MNESPYRDISSHVTAAWQRGFEWGMFVGFALGVALIMALATFRIFGFFGR